MSTKFTEHSCPHCGGMTRFNPSTKSLICDFCQSLIAIDDSEAQIITFDYFQFAGSEDAKLAHGNIEHVIRCQSCGGITQLSSGEISAACSFCGSVHVANVDNFKGINPQFVIPFAINPKDAELRYDKWRKKLLLAPKAFKKKSSAANHAVYIPIWSYYADTFSNYTAKRGDVHYVQRRKVVNGKRTTVTERVVVWTNVRGEYSHFFSSIHVNGSNKDNSTVIDRISNFNEQRLVKFDEKYLAGFAAEMYSINLEEGFLVAKRTINGQLKGLITSYIGGDQVANLRFNTDFNSIRFRLFLAPVYIYKFQHKNKFYPYAINGESGFDHGKYPISAGKLILLLIPIFGWIILAIINSKEAK